MTQVLLDTGFQMAHFARGQDLNTPVEEPEREERIFILARKAAA